MHLWVPLGNNRFYPLNSDWYEDWIQDTFDNRRAQFDHLPGHLTDLCEALR